MLSPKHGIVRRTYWKKSKNKQTNKKHLAKCLSDTPSNDWASFHKAAWENLEAKRKKEPGLMWDT